MLLILIINTLFALAPAWKDSFSLILNQKKKCQYRPFEMSQVSYDFIMGFFDFMEKKGDFFMHMNSLKRFHNQNQIAYDQAFSEAQIDLLIDTIGWKVDTVQLQPSIKKNQEIDFLDEKNRKMIQQARDEKERKRPFYNRLNQLLKRSFLNQETEEESRLLNSTMSDLYGFKNGQFISKERQKIFEHLYQEYYCGLLKDSQKKEVSIESVMKVRLRDLMACLPRPYSLEEQSKYLKKVLKYQRNIVENQHQIPVFEVPDPQAQNVIFIGALGALGPMVLERLVSQGYSVTVIDILENKLAQERLGDFKDHPQVHYYKHDASQLFDVNTSNVSHVINFASVASPVAYRQTPRQELYSGGIGCSLNAYLLATKYQAICFFPSTSENYGDLEAIWSAERVQASLPNPEDIVPFYNNREEEHILKVDLYGGRGLYRQSKINEEQIVACVSLYEQERNRGRACQVLKSFLGLGWMDSQTNQYIKRASIFDSFLVSVRQMKEGKNCSKEDMSSCLVSIENIRLAVYQAIYRSYEAYEKEKSVGVLLHQFFNSDDFQILEYITNDSIEAVAQPHLEKFLAFSTFSMLPQKPHIAKDMKHSSRLENDKNASHFPSREVVQQSRIGFYLGFFDQFEKKWVPQLEDIQQSFYFSPSIPRVVRIFCGSGKKMKSGDGRVIQHFICQGLQGKFLTPHISLKGENYYRSFTDNEDLADMIMAILTKEKGIDGAINIGSFPSSKGLMRRDNVNMTHMIDLALKVNEILKDEYGVHATSMMLTPFVFSDGNPRKRDGDRSLFKNIYGSFQTRSLPHIIREIVEEQVYEMQLKNNAPSPSLIPFFEKSLVCSVTVKNFAFSRSDIKDKSYSGDLILLHLKEGVSLTHFYDKSLEGYTPYLISERETNRVWDNVLEKKENHSNWKTYLQEIRERVSLEEKSLLMINGGNYCIHRCDTIFEKGKGFNYGIVPQENQSKFNIRTMLAMDEQNRPHSIEVDGLKWKEEQIRLEKMGIVSAVYGKRILHQGEIVPLLAQRPGLTRTLVEEWCEGDPRHIFSLPDGGRLGSKEIQNNPSIAIEALNGEPLTLIVDLLSEVIYSGVYISCQNKSQYLLEQLLSSKINKPQSETPSLSLGVLLEKEVFLSMEINLDLNRQKKSEIEVEQSILTSLLKGEVFFENRELIPEGQTDASLLKRALEEVLQIILEKYYSYHQDLKDSTVYFWKNNQLKLILPHVPANIYPHTIVGFGKDEQLRVAFMMGLSGRRGSYPERLALQLKKEGWVEAFVLGNGKDVTCQIDNKIVIDSGQYVSQTIENLRPLQHMMVFSYPRSLIGFEYSFIQMCA